MTRRDRRGRRIGRNLWREAVTDAWFFADHAWWLAREAVTFDYDTENREYQREHPRPNLRDFMHELAPVWGSRNPEAVS